MKRLTAIVLCMVMVLSLSSFAAAENARYDKLTIAIAADPESLLPTNGNGTPKNQFYYNIYETLFDYDNEGNMVPSIGKSITIVDERTYDVEIYDSVYDSDGNHITASDVVYSVNWLVNAGEALKYDLYQSIEAVGDYTVRWRCSSTPTTWDDLEFPLCRSFIFSQAAFEGKNFANAPVGTGNYIVKSFTAGSSLVLEANDDYWLLKQPEIMDTHLDLHRATVQTMEYQIIAEAAQAQIALEQGKVDYCDYIQALMIEQFRNPPYSDKYNTEIKVQGDYYYLNPNCYEGIMADENFRKALWYVIDSAAVAKVMGGEYTPMDTLGNSYYPDFNEDWNNEATYMNTFDPELAKEYLAKTNYQGETLILLGDSTEASKNAMQMIQNLANLIGVKFEIVSQIKTMAQSTVASPTGWHLCLDIIGGSSLVGSYNRMMGNGVNTYEGGKYSISWLQDDTMQSMYEVAKADATHDDEHVKALIDYVAGKGYLYGLAGASSAVVYTKDVTNLYRREGYATLGASEFAGFEAAHSANVQVMDTEMPEPVGLAANQYQFIDVLNPDEGIKFEYTMTLEPDEGAYKIKALSPDGDVFEFTGDHWFKRDDLGDNCFLTTPHHEGIPPFASFYEEDGVCYWQLLPNHNLVPLKLASFEGYKANVLATNNVFTYQGGDNAYTLTLEADEGAWTLEILSLGETLTFTGDHWFKRDELGTDCFLTTPPHEGIPAVASFYEEDGVCYWQLDRASGTVTPLNAGR